MNYTTSFPNGKVLTARLVVWAILAAVVVVIAYWVYSKNEGPKPQGVTISGLATISAKIAEKQIRASTSILKMPRYSWELRDIDKGSSALTAALIERGIPTSIQQVSCLRQDAEGKRLCRVQIGSAGNYVATLVHVQSSDKLVGPFVVYGNKKWPWKLKVPFCFGRVTEHDCPSVDPESLFEKRDGYSSAVAVVASFDLGSIPSGEAKQVFLATLTLVLEESVRAGGEPLLVEQKRIANRLSYNLPA